MTLFLAKAAPPPLDGATVAGAVAAAAVAFKWLLEWELSCGGPAVK